MKNLINIMVHVLLEATSVATPVAQLYSASSSQGGGGVKICANKLSQTRPRIFDKTAEITRES